MSMVPGSYFGIRSVHEPLYQQIWDPFQEFHYGGTLVAPRPVFSTQSPFELANLDWKETPEAHVFKADLPGLKKNEVKVEVEDGRVLCIRAEKNMEKEVKSETWHRVERSSGVFVRRFRLPENAKVYQLTAYLENGVLTVTVPKEEAKHHPKRTIQIHGK
ncbi:17.5 kDa class I heat shock protein-like [Durio zibethinus]|uniref:17.5 kDa class I heat shock protein-like n=1 Tax=Durio zibethinus TaxID=66656 RepID=A0A6P5Z0U7_DURZI|nr:17.5 kDa class I heat shock protein-like [Durio zibethinus]